MMGNDGCPYFFTMRQAPRNWGLTPFSPFAARNLLTVELRR